MADVQDNVWIPRRRQNSNPYRFTSGHESDSPPPCSPTSSGSPVFTLPDIPQKPEKVRPISPKPAKRNRKLSLFSFNFSSKASADEKPGRCRRISHPPTFTVPERGTENKSKNSTSSDGSASSSSREGSQLSLNGCTSIEGENNILREILLETLRLQFDNVPEYKREMCDRLAKNVSQLVKRRVESLKESAGQQCKIVSLVYVGAIREEGIAVASQALLESQKDNFTVASYRNGHIFAVAGVMATPLEKGLAI